MTPFRLASLAPFVLLAGCVVGPAPYGPAPGLDDEVAVTDVAPPAPYVETLSDAPFADGVWIGGYWGWEGGRHQWIAGHWEHGRPGYEWRAHRWEQHDGRWHLHQGGWHQR